MPIDIAALLEPVSTERPTGDDLRYDPIMLQIREARRTEEDVSQGVWEHEVKTADYALAFRLSKEALTRRGKDLQIAAWLTEALLYQEGLPGLDQGIEYIQQLLERYWDTVHPQPDEDGDLEFRAVPLRWVATQLDRGIRDIPLTVAGHGWRQYKQSRTVPTEEDAKRDANKEQQRADALAEGKLAPEEFDAGADATPAAFFQKNEEELDRILERVNALGAFCDERFGDSAPDFGPLRAVLEELRVTTHVLLRKKGPAPAPKAQAPAPPPPRVEEPRAEYAATPSYEAPVAAPPPARSWPAAAPAGPEPSDPEDACRWILTGARYLVREASANAAPYLVSRALRWGELRTMGSELDPSFLEAPPAELRVEMKRLAASGDWEQLLQLAENAAGEPCGRGWLDIHRYSVTACRNLGLDAVAGAIVAELRALLADYPSLPGTTLADDTPAANPETQAWLREEGVLGGAGAARAHPAAETPSAAAEAGAGNAAFDEAMDLARSGQLEDAVDLMSAELARERSGRGRFLRKLQLAEVCLETSGVEMALPLLQDLAAEIESRGLENWEDPGLIARALALLYSCTSDEEDPEGNRRRLYAKVCSLDPSRAVRLSR